MTSVATLVATAAVLVPGSAAWAGPDDVGRVIEALRYGRSFKVRIQAAAALARFRDRRVVPELGRAAESDRNPVVRIYALRALAKAPGGEVDDAGARVAIRRALDDRRPDVRQQAQRSLAELDRRRLQQAPPLPPPRPSNAEMVVAVRGVGDRSGRASAALKAALRATILTNLRATRGVRATEAAQGVNYAIDASIARFTHVAAGTDLEITVAVELVVSRPPRGIVLIASGEASVIEPRSQVRGDRKTGMEVDAMQHAVRSAHENLARFFASPGASYIQQ
jgi:hypothetical protein